MRIRLLAALTAILACLAMTPASAVELIVNGNFSTVTMTAGNPQHSTLFGTRFSNLPSVAGWQTEGYNFIFMDNPTYNGGAPLSQTGADDATDGAYTSFDPGSGRFTLWGPDLFGTMNGLTNSPLGGNFLGGDGAYYNAPVYQTVTGLEVGRTYTLSFYWAAAQQAGFGGLTTEAWTVCMGVCAYTKTFPGVEDGYAQYVADPNNTIIQTPIVSNADRGFVPWTQQTMTFTANATSETLSFLAYGTPLGQPPFSLLDGVSLQVNPAVPEPTTWSMMLIGFGVIGGVMRTRRRSVNGRLAKNAQII